MYFETSIPSGSVNFSGGASCVGRQIDARRQIAIKSHGYVYSYYYVCIFEKN